MAQPGTVILIGTCLLRVGVLGLCSLHPSWVPEPQIAGTSKTLKPHEKDEHEAQG